MISADFLSRLIHEPELEHDALRVRNWLASDAFAEGPLALPEDDARRSYARFRSLVRALPITAHELRKDPSRLFAMQEWVSLVDGTLCTVLSIHYSLCLGSIAHHASGRRDLEDIAGELERGDSVGVFLATEVGYGNNVGSLETEAVYDPASREFVLHTPSPRARKYMPNTALPVPKIAVVMARLRVDGADHGVFPFIVRLRDARGEPCRGVRIHAMGEKASYSLDNAITSFDRVRIPKRHLLCGEHSSLSDDGHFETTIRSRSKRFMKAMDRVQLGRLGLSGGIASLLRGATFIAHRYSRQRLTFAVGGPDRPVLDYRNQQRDVFGALATAYALSIGLRRGRREVCSLHAGDERADSISQRLALLKALVTYETSEGLLKLRERVGAAGLFVENRIITYLNQTQGLITAEGDNQLIMMKAAREMLLGQHYDPPSPSEGAESLEPDDLLEPENLRTLFRVREARLCAELRTSMQGALRDATDPFDAWNDHVNPSLRLARSRGERELVERFTDALAQAPDSATREALTLLASLFALQRLERDAAWFLAEGLISAQQVKALPQAIDRLCSRIDEKADELVEGFGIGNDILRAPIASDDYVSAYDRQVRSEAE